MNLNSFIYAIEIERSGSINRAAHNLYISQPNMSSSLKALEDELGYQIFNRSRRGIVPTPEGYLFLQSAKAIQAELEKVRQIPARLSSTTGISLSAPWSSQILRTFLEFKANNQPNIQDTYKETGLIQNFKDVQENRYRLALYYCFRSRSIYHQKEAQKTNLAVEMVAYHIPAVALLSKSHPLAKHDALSLRDICHYPLALFEDFEKADWIDILKISSNQNLLYLFDRGAIEDTLLSGNYISVVPKGSIWLREEDDIIELPLLDLNDSLNICLLRHKGYSLNSREKAFLRYLKKSIKNECLG